MDADTPKLSINMPQDERDQAHALYAVTSTWPARQYADEARNVGENNTLNRMRRDTRALMADDR